MDLTEYIRCPVCGNDVEREEKSLCCVGGAKRHLFDFSSDGYVNLLSPGKGKNARSGDDKAMISARARFLDGGFYNALSQRIGRLISTLAENQGKSEVLFADCACGEGYHTCNILKTTAENSVLSSALAFDASKYGVSYGVRRASRAKLSERAFFAAANIFSLPVKDSALDFALSIFAPVAWDEMKRVLKDDGYLIVASSGERHLYELRKVLYDEPRTASGEVNNPEFFSVVEQEIFSYPVSLLKNEDVKNLFYMTPFCYKTSKSDAEKLLSVDTLDVTVEVKLTVFEKVI